MFVDIKECAREAEWLSLSGLYFIVIASLSLFKL